MTISEAASVVAVLGGVMTLADYLIRRWLQKNHDETIRLLTTHLAEARKDRDERGRECAQVRDELNELRGSYDAKAAQLVVANHRVASLEEEAKAKGARIGELNEAQAALDKQQKTHDNRIRRALQLQGALWTQPVMANTPEFVPLAKRRTPIVSVLNLKGGVGKTTLTAYLAWALSDRGYRVLLVDLDLQGSLSSMLLREDELNRLGGEADGRLLQHFLNGTPRRPLREFVRPVPQFNRQSRLVAASDHLAYAELSQTVRWLLRVGGVNQTWNGRHDGRMILRKALHRAGVYKKFDVVLMDCPPLVNLCCTNALAASDYVLAPVTPSVKAIERLPALLGRIRDVQQEGVNPDLKPLGVVVNRTDGKTLTPAERQLLLDLPRVTNAVYGAPVDLFDTTVQQRAAVRDGEEYFTAPDESHPLRVTFEALAEEFVKRLPGVCRRPEERVKKEQPPKSLGGM